MARANRPLKAPAGQATDAAHPRQMAARHHQMAHHHQTDRRPEDRRPQIAGKFPNIYIPPRFLL